jgi:Secretion system C-terminal sorting domain
MTKINKSCYVWMALPPVDGFGRETWAANNYALTSCSWNNNGVQSLNWLISPKLFIPDSTYRLFWKSLSYLGPNYVDGYKVLVSETNNIPENNVYLDTLFVAAETLIALGSSSSLNINDYIFSHGYLHADSYTDTAYYFIDKSTSKPFYHGKLEPHEASLAKYAGKSIYIAFLHDTNDNEKMQLDDIIVSNATSGIPDLVAGVRFEVFPNPSRDFAHFQWTLETPQAIHVQLLDLNGRVLREKYIEQSSVSRYVVSLEGLPKGMYQAVVHTQKGTANKLLVKQ